MTPTARTLDALRRTGYIACVVERWIESKGIRVDAFNFADILAARPADRRITLIQATTLPNVSARITKIRSKPEASAWIKSGGIIEVWGWIKRGNRWRVKIVDLHADGLEAVFLAKPGRKPRGEWKPATLFDRPLDGGPYIESS
jgi:hypothetical protein